MFNKTKIIIAIAKDKIIAAQVKTKGKDKIKRTLEYGWDLQTLDVVLSKIKKEFKAKKVRFLIGENLSYVLRLKVPSNLGQKKEREFISQEISKKIPEILTNSDWDYKELHFNVTQKGKSGEAEKEVLVFSLVKEVFKALSEAIKKLDIQVEAIEPEAVAKTRDANPLIGLALKTDIQGRDENVLNLDPIEVSFPEEEVITKADEEKLLTKEAKELEKQSQDNQDQDTRTDPEEESEKPEKKTPMTTKILLAIFLLMVVIASAVFVYPKFIKPRFINNSQDNAINEEQEKKPTPTQVVEKKEVVEEAETINLEDYKIQVQNGTGIAGEADVVSEILEAEGFENIETANADSYDYIETEVKTKEDISSEIYDIIDRSLNSDYLVKLIDEVLENGDAFDVVVVVGERI